MLACLGPWAHPVSLSPTLQPLAKLDLTFNLWRVRQAPPYLSEPSPKRPPRARTPSYAPSRPLAPPRTTVVFRLLHDRLADAQCC